MTHEINQNQDPQTQPLSPQQEETISEVMKEQTESLKQILPKEESQQEKPGNRQQKNNKEEALDDESLKKVIEALIFASDKPLSIKQIKDILGDVDTRLIRKLINELKDEYTKHRRSFNITEVAGGFQFATDSTYGRWLKKLYKIKQTDYLTGPSLETIAIIAYRQPATKAEIEFIRGVSVDGVISSLLQKGFVRIVGKKDVVGRPFLYGTTALFLQYFGLNSIEELPVLSEFKEADLDFNKKKSVDLIESNKNNTSIDNGGNEDAEDKEPTQEDRQDR